MQGSEDMPPWVALAIGNTHLRWAYFREQTLRQQWTTPHVSPSDFQGISANRWSAWSAVSPALRYHQEQQGDPFPSLWVVSVVPSQTLLWRAYPQTRVVGVPDIPLNNTYATLGVDRALALWAAGCCYGWPVLVIDGGTALTLTGADAQGQLVGGAISPGLGLQVRSLHTATAALPQVDLPRDWPVRWARETSAAIQSGIIYTVVAGLSDAIQAWCRQFPQSKVVLTGGDQSLLYTYLQAQRSQAKHGSDGMHHLIGDDQLLFAGIQLLHQGR